jgi:hypothetical protein
MTDETTTTKKPLLSPIEVGAGAGAAVITAFASSYLGTAGTLTGAAVASVLGTVSTSVLRSSAQTSAQQLKEKTARLRETRVQQTGVADVRPVESEDIDPYGTQFFGVPDWIDPEDGTDAPGGAPWTAGTGPNDGTQRLGPAGGTRPLGSELGGGPAPTERLGTGRTSDDGTRPLGSEPGRPADADQVWTGVDGPLGSGSEPGSAWGAPTERLDGSGTGVTGPGRPRRPAVAGAPGSGRPGAGTGPGRRVRPRWVLLGASAAAAFAVAMGAITGIEAAAGKPLSGLAGQESGGGTTIGRATGSDGGAGSRTTPTPTPTTSGAGSTGTEPASPGATATSPSGGGLSATAPTPAPTSPSSVPSATRPAPTQAPSASPNPLTSERP